MIVVDASVLVNLLVYADGDGQKAREALLRDADWTAPEHWKVEVFSVIRSLAIGQKIDEAIAIQAVVQLPHLAVESAQLDGLLARMWRLRDNISGHDSAYVALAQVRKSTLFTADARLARAAAAHCGVELV
ncbi:hypothetical protein GCM10023321_67850 [Pseudonocardia eucalypti]|uniref:Ribonuclease VapC n=1 Tax=Pseudonocardia eucalypti TaxID=648755 RepID=A0ABP9R1C6_9PSEU|nr:putative nucleic acid-binding protein [Pseudonocardia eucalypti]